MKSLHVTTKIKAIEVDVAVTFFNLFVPSVAALGRYNFRFYG